MNYFFHYRNKCVLVFSPQLFILFYYYFCFLQVFNLSFYQILQKVNMRGVRSYVQSVTFPCLTAAILENNPLLLSSELLVH